MIELAAAYYRGRKQLRTIHRLVNPGISIPSVASAMHHLVNQNVRHAMEWYVAEANLQDFAGDAVIVTHHDAFERSFIPSLFNDRWICTYRLARHLWPSAPKHALQVLRYELKLNVRVEHPHRAEGDVTVTTALLFRALDEYRRRGLPWGIEEVICFAKRPLPAKHPVLRLVSSA